MHTINDILGVALFAPRDSQALPEAAMLFATGTAAPRGPDAAHAVAEAR
jgi:hypothetical protein